MNITTKVTGDDKLIAKLDKMPGNIKSALEKAITRSAIKLQGAIVREKLSGQVLKRKTGTLAASIQWDVKATEGSVVATVGSRIKEKKPLKYAAIHEYGFKGQVNVREHLRMMTQAWGRPVAPQQITVGPHTMNMNMPERSYVRSKFSEMKEEINKAIVAAVAEGTKGAVS